MTTDDHCQSHHEQDRHLEDPYHGGRAVDLLRLYWNGYQTARGILPIQSPY